MNIENQNDYKTLLSVLEKKSAGKDFIDFSSKIIKTEKQIIGVRTPELKKLAKEIFKDSHDTLFELGDNKFYEEVIIKGLVLCFHKESDYVFPRLKKLANCYDCWAEVDLTASLKCVKGNDQDFDFFCKLLESDKEFVVRLGVVGLMKFFINDYERVLSVLDGVKCDKYYVNMAIAWLISEILIKNSQNAPEIMQKIIKNHHFNNFIINKGIQKACESFRIDEKTKQELRKLKV
ncbi:MAG: DNA alkylation repair protein [Clostridia bacterium]|nr:DNA alkylation repair protein [Clostridia bacterium]